ncbi:MAG TPA: chemotaxis protein CheW [bacterium]|jgi:purine-binding chemotaxis protein CheW|nr:chemotaxis protein CheW [bacterium]
MATEALKRDESKMGADARAGKYLTFYLNTEEYGLGILKVQEIIGKQPITPVPRTPGYIRGVINLRGRIIPIMDLKMKFAMGDTAITDESCIIVTQTSGVMMGVLVDKVSEVLNINSADIEDTPSFGVAVDTAFLLGVGKTGDKVKLLLDIDKTISGANLADLKKASGQA